MSRQAALAALCGTAALFAAAPALAAGPSLAVSPSSSAFSTSGSTVLRFSDDGLDPTATLDVYSPVGYGADLSQPFGSTIGGVDAQAKTIAGADVRLAGAIRSVDPAGYTQAAAVCTPGRLVHDAVWTLALNGEGLSLSRLPVFVDRAAAGTSLRACFPQPGSAGFEIRLTRATLTLNGIFTNPAASGEYRWTSMFTTYSVPGTPPSESQTLVRLPPRLTLARKLIHASRHRTFVKVSGSLSEYGRAVRGVRVEVLSGPSVSTLGRLAYATSFTGGKFAVVAPLRAKTVFRARVAVPLREGPLSQCLPFSLRPDAICTRLTLAPFSAQSPTLTASPSRRWR
ncbi:MAG TPA: hypothetical protein VF895_01170 [Gaiellaceae bacterium]